MRYPVTAILGGPHAFTAADVLAEAVALLVGPWAEHAMGRGDFYSSPGEIAALCMYACKYAELLGIGWREAMRVVLTCTVALLDRYDRAIHGAALALLERRCISYVYDRDRALLYGVTPTFLAGPWSCNPRRLEELIRLFVNAPVKLPALVREIVPEMRL